MNIRQKAWNRVTDFLSTEDFSGFTKDAITTIGTDVLASAIYSNLFGDASDNHIESISWGKS
jgi:hypothetical protein